MTLPAANGGSNEAAKSHKKPRRGGSSLSYVMSHPCFFFRWVL